MSRPQKRLAADEDRVATVDCPISVSELVARIKDYTRLSDGQFAYVYSRKAFDPSIFHLHGEQLSTQANSCTDPFCRWFGQPQEQFATRYGHRGKFPSKYRLVGSDPAVACNPDPADPHFDEGRVSDKTASAMSNWSLAEEIARLVRLESIVEWRPDYRFHKGNCQHDGTSPFEHRSNFRLRGKRAGSNSTRWQCKTCGKITNVLPEVRENFTYNLNRPEVLHAFAKLLLNRTPVKRTCEVLGIGVKTYYLKLELLYRRCLEFLERHERQAFAKRSLDTIWLETDQLIYNLNHVRKRGYGKVENKLTGLNHRETSIVISGDLLSRYIFRADVSYDWQTTLDDIDRDTQLFKDNHARIYVRKHARLRRWSASPQPPTPKDTQPQAWYEGEKDQFELWKMYVDGLQTNPTYTAYAHYWLIRRMLTVDNWRFVSDRDASLQRALIPVFAQEIKDQKAHYFVYSVPEWKLAEAKQASGEARSALREWAKSRGCYVKGSSLREYVVSKLAEDLRSHQLFQELILHGKRFVVPAENPIDHPLPSMDQGLRTIDCLTDLSRANEWYLAGLLATVDNKATSAFQQQIRRRISILERPLVTARTKDGKSYAYTNSNPKYAQYAVTILRTFYNFCMPYKEGSQHRRDTKTPAERIGIADRSYTLTDVIYFS